MNAPTVVYLESFIESTGGLPPELQRILNTIKALDEKCEDHSARLQQKATMLLNLPPQFLHQGGPSEEYKRLYEEWEQSKKLLLQFAEEKVQLSQQAYDLVEQHAVTLEQTIEEFEGDLRASGLLDGANGLGDLYTPDMTESGRGRTPKLEEQWPLPHLDRSDSMAAFPGLQAPVAGQPKKQPQVGGHKGKRPRDEDGSGLYKKQKSASTNFLAAATFDDGLYAQPTFEQEVQVAFINPIPAGFKAAAHRPQAPGRFLMQADISPELKGRHAELFWPDDKMWYYIEIQDVDVLKKTAQIVYTTGEVEELNLNEIADANHMVLIPQEYMRQ